MEEVHVFRHEKIVYAVDFSPDGRYVLTASGDDTASLWNLADYKQVRVWRHDGLVTRALFSPDGSFVLTASTDRTARLWDVESGKAVARWPHDDSVYTIAFSPNGRLVLTGSNDHTARLFDIARYFDAKDTVFWLQQRAAALLAYNMANAPGGKLPRWRSNKVLEYAVSSTPVRPVVTGRTEE